MKYSMQISYNSAYTRSCFSHLAAGNGSCSNTCSNSIVGIFVVGMHT